MASVVYYSYINESSIITVGALFPALSIVFVMLRFYVRQKQRVQLLADDWLLIPALVIFVGMGVSFIIGARGHGLGSTTGVSTTAPVEVQFTHTSPQTILAAKIEFFCQLVSVLCIGCVKLSVVMFYRRMFVTPVRTWFSVVTAIMGGIIIAWTFSFFFVFLFYCKTPIAEEWGTIDDVLQYCSGSLNDDLSLGITDAIVDIAILSVPIPMILGLQLDLTKKISLLGIFLLGGFCVAASITRMAIFIQVVVVGFNPSLEGDKDVALILFWTMVETGMAIVAACLPTLKSLLGSFTIEAFARSIRDLFPRCSTLRAHETTDSINDCPRASSSMEIINKGNKPAVQTYAYVGWY